MPDSKRCEGRVVASKPLNYAGQLIDNFELTFKEGKVVSFKAEKGEEALRSLIELDEGSSRLGEVALVPYESPISLSGVLFFNTLFDENASCHVALGRGFNMVLPGFENMTFEEIKEKGVNDSLIHVDFMIGTDDMSIVGITREGREISVFKNGTWAF